MKRAEIEQLLPGIFQRTAKPGDLLAALLDVMEELHRPDQEILDRLDAVFNPRRTDDSFVPLLAHWLDQASLLEGSSGDRLPARSQETISTGLGRLRELIASAAELSKWTGTSNGLLRFLHVATGDPHFEIRENVTGDGKPRPFHITVIAPPEMKLHRELITRIIESEKPACVTYELML